jgi:multicomponent Na+:H+ antiporter subunit D
MLPLMRRTLTITLDVDWLYRRPLPAIAAAARTAAQRLDQVLARQWTRPVWRLKNNPLRARIEAYNFADNWPTGDMVLWIAVILSGYLLLDAFG